VSPITIHVPTLNDAPPDFDRLAEIWGRVNGDGLDVSFDFSECRFLQQNAVAFLGGLIRLVQARGGRVRINWDSLRGDIEANLVQNGFSAAFARGPAPRQGNSIPFREDRASDKAVLMDYLRAGWLGRGWVEVSRPLADAICGQAWEIYANAFEHAHSEIGVFSCGQHYPKNKALKLSIVDFGVGIPSSVRVYLGQPNLAAGEAMRWAFREGTTTLPNGTGRGMGLYLLRKFVEINKGRLEYYSHDGHAIINEWGERYGARPDFFEGTLVNITFRCDGRLYRLSSEADDEPPF
jgi:signal transduction histidine kinase